jgi:enterochelin esterase-like enzyme
MISGATSGLTSHAYVYLPPQYFQPAFRHTQFPGVEVLTGYPGRDRDLITSINYPAAMLGLIDTHQAHPMVLVMMRPAVVLPRDTECTDVPGGPQVLTFFAADVPSAVTRAYRVRVSDWGAAGLSTGAYCATKLAMLYPNQFPAAASISGYYTALRDNTTGDLWGGSSSLRKLNDLEWRLQHLPPPAVSLLMTIGTNETGAEGIPDSERFLALVKPPMEASLVFVPGGRHNVAGFAREVAPTLRWLSGRLPPP